MKRALLVAVSMAVVAGVGAPGRPGPQGGCQSAGVPEGQRRLGQPQQRRLRHDEQHDDALGRDVPQDVPERQDPGRGQGLARRRPPALIAGTSQFGPMSRAMRADRDRPVRGEVRLQADRSSAPRYDALAVYVNKDNPIEKLTLAQVDAVFSKTPQARRQGDVNDVGRARPHRRLGEPADPPLRPQLGLAAPTASSRSTR